MKKIIVSVMFIVLIFFAYGCSSQGDNKRREGKASVINTEEAIKLSEKYLSLLINENYEEALQLCSEDIKEGAQKKGAQKKGGSLRLVGFMRENYNEAGSSLILNYKLSLVKKGEPRADLDNLSITVSRKDEDYKITKLSAKTEKEAYLEGNSLRQRKESEIESGPIIRLHRLPKEIYSKNNKAEYTKVPIPNKRFSAVSFGYQGDSIAIASEDGSSYIGIIAIEDSTQTMSNMGGGGGGKGSESQQGNEQEGLTGEDISSEKPIGKEISSIDVIENSTINYLVFSGDEKYIMAEYAADGVTSLKVYEAESGEPINKELEKIFPVDSYRLTFKIFTEDQLIFKVEGIKDNSQQENGIYGLSLEDHSINKLE